MAVDEGKVEVGEEGEDEVEEGVAMEIIKVLMHLYDTVKYFVSLIFP